MSINSGKDDDEAIDYSLQYKAWHNDSPEHVEGMTQFLRRKLAPFLPPPGPAGVLDIGCGMGFALLTLRKLGFSNLCGIDTDPEQVKACQGFGLPVELVSDSVAFLAARPEQFGTVLLLDVLEHMPAAQQIRLMRAVYRALEPGGRVIVQVPNSASIMATWQRYIDFTHHSSFTPVSMRFVLQSAGFEDIRIQGQGPLRRPSLRLWRPSARAALRRWLVRYAWRQVLTVEIGEWFRIDDIPCELDMLTVALKAPRPGSSG